MIKNTILISILLSVLSFNYNYNNDDIYYKIYNKTDNKQINKKIEDIKNKYKKNKINSNNITNEYNKNEIKRLDNFLFIGDSYFTILKPTINKKSHDTYIYAESGTTPTYWLDKVEDMEDDVEGVVVQLGVNGASYNTNIPDMKKLIDKLHNKYPNKKIYICKVFNVSPLFKKVNTDKFNGHINNFNKEIEKYCNKIDNVEFIDCTEGLVKNGELDVTTDGLHVSSEGQSIYYNNILEEINKVGD